MRFSFKKTNDGISKKLNAMVTRANDPTAFINRVIYREYQEAQIKRWETENSSEGKRWKRLNATYHLRKLKKYAAYPYAGTRMLVATGDLFKSVVGPGRENHRKLVTKSGLTVQTTLSYAPSVAEVRPFMEFSKRTTKAWKQSILDYIKG